MYDETNVPSPEYRVRPVVRHLITRYCYPYQSRDGSCGSSGSSQVVAEVENEQRAQEIAEALADAELGERMVVGDSADMAEALSTICKELGCHNNLDDILHAIDALRRPKAA